MIELDKINKAFQMGETVVPVLRDISCSIKSGDYVAILGPSGSGKSTLMNILGCLDNPTTGSYRLDNIEVSDYSSDQLADIRNKKIGFVFQSFNLLPHLNAMHNVALPLVYRGSSYQARCMRAKETLEQVGLGNKITYKPNELSGGQRQRVAIARALVGQPEVIFADEPTGNLDSKTGQEIIALFEQLVDQGKTLVMVTHDLQLAARAKRIIRLFDGMITLN